MVYLKYYMRKAALSHLSNTLVKALASTTIIVTTLFSGNSVYADDRTAHSALVSENASFTTPGTVNGRVEAIAIEGDTVYVGGTFTQVQMALDGQIFNQPYLYAYSKSTGAIITDFNPVLNNEVYALQTTGEGSGIFVGGAFTTVNGLTNRKGLAKLDDSGDLVQGFYARPNKRVYTMDRSGNTLYIGGNFTNVSTVPVEYLAAIDTQTGALLPNIDLDFNGEFSSTITTGYPSVQDIEVTSDNQLMVVVGQFRTINGISRPRLALLELGNQTVVSNWNTNVFDDDCPARRFPQYIKALDIAPDDSYFITGSTGFRRIDDPACDSVIRFELDDLTNTDVQPTWVAYTGGDTVFEVAASEHAIYAGGHFRWFNNNRSRNGASAGPGAVERAGLAALDPLNGLPLLDWKSDRNPRGVGVFSLEVEPEGLYIGDDTDFLNNFKHPKFKFLPITSNTIARPTPASLPTTIINEDGGSLEAMSFNGTTFGTPAAISNTVWSSARGAMYLGGQLFHADDSGNMWVSVLDNNNTFGARTQVDLFELTASEWNLSQLTGMFFDYKQGRVYYTLANDTRLLWRAFTPSGPLFGENEFVAEEQGDIPWYNVRGMDVVNDKLYFGRTNGYLYRATIFNSEPVSGTTQIISGPGFDGLNWSSPVLAFSSDGPVLPTGSDAEFEFESAGSTSYRSFQKFEFPVEAGEAVNIRVTWDDSNAQLNLFLRDENDQLVDSSNSSTSSAEKWLSAPAGAGGTYTLAVKIKDGSTGYTVSVNPAESAPAPAADNIFSASGSDTVDSWKVFKFDVEAGDLVEGSVAWDDPNATVRLFLRDETNTLIDRDVDESGSPETVSATAATSGRWSVGVSIRSGDIDYEVLVNTTP